MISFIIGCALFGIAGVLLDGVSLYRTLLVVALISVGTNLVNSSGLF